jgi:hypothetical protein
MRTDLDGSRYLTLDDVRTQWRVTSKPYDMLKTQEEKGPLSPKDARRLATWEKKVVESYARVVERWASRVEKAK